MARKAASSRTKKRTTKKSGEKWIALSTECGSWEQLGIIYHEDTGDYVYPSEAEARKSVDAYLKVHGQDGASFVIAKVSDIAKVGSAVWGASDLD